MPELSVDLSALPDADRTSAAVIVWLARLLAAHPDVAVRMRTVPEVFSADSRVSSNPLPWARWRFQSVAGDATDLPAAETIAATMHELDAAPENGPFGGAGRQAQFVRVTDTRRTLAGTLRSARAEALLALEHDSPSTADTPADRPLEVVVPEPPADAQPDLERTWAGW